MALNPNPNDPNYESELKRKELEPETFGEVVGFHTKQNASNVETSALHDDKLDAVVEAIGSLDPDTDFTSTGLPKTDVLSEMVGFPVNARLRDIAFETFNTEG